MAGVSAATQLPGTRRRWLRMKASTAGKCTHMPVAMPVSSRFFTPHFAQQHVQRGGKKGRMARLEKGEVVQSRCQQVSDPVQACWSVLHKKACGAGSTQRVKVCARTADGHGSVPAPRSKPPPAGCPPGCANNELVALQPQAQTCLLAEVPLKPALGCPRRKRSL